MSELGRIFAFGPAPAPCRLAASPPCVAVSLALVLGACGQPGGGPAEFGTAWAPVRADEGMGVVDSRRGLLRTYAPDGTLLHERPVEDQLGFPTEMRSVYFGDLGWTWRVDGGLLQDRYPPQPTIGPIWMTIPGDTPAHGWSWTATAPNWPG